MSQYTTGTVTVTNGDATVVGVGTKFLTAVTIGDIFLRDGDILDYLVASITDDLNLELVGTYAGITGSGVSYAISRDFTAPDSIPYMNTKDIGTAQIFRRAILKIQSLLTTGVTQLTDVPFSFIGDASAGYIPYDGWVMSRAVQINAVSSYAAIAPTGANMIWELTKGAVVQTQDIVLTDGSNHEKTTLTPISYAISDRLGFKCKQVGSTDPGSEIIMTIHYQ